MGEANTRTKGQQAGQVYQTEIELPADLYAQLEALPDARRGATAHVWTQAEDAALRKYWPAKRKAGVAQAFGLCEDVCRRRYRELTED